MLFGPTPRAQPPRLHYAQSLCVRWPPLPPSYQQQAVKDPRSPHAQPGGIRAPLQFSDRSQGVQAVPVIPPRLFSVVHRGEQPPPLLFALVARTPPRLSSAE